MEINSRPNQLKNKVPKLIFPPGSPMRAAFARVGVATGVPDARLSSASIRAVKQVARVGVAEGERLDAQRRRRREFGDFKAEVRFGPKG
jgi:hypothetical protein